MALSTTVAQATVGQGNPAVDTKREDITVTGTGNTLLPASGGFTPKCRSGIWRLKAVKNSGTSVTLAIRVLVSDGTTTRMVDTIPASVADDNIDISGHIPVQDFDFDRLTFALTPGGTTPSFNVDVQFAGSP